MFDKTYITPHANTTIRMDSTVHEHRAPTDESVRLLHDLEREAREKVLGSVRLEGCEVSCVVHALSTFLDDQVEIVAQLKIGKTEMKVAHTVLFRPVDTRASLMERVAFEMSQKVGAAIARKVLAVPMGKAFSNMESIFPR